MEEGLIESLKVITVSFSKLGVALVSAAVVSVTASPELDLLLNCRINNIKTAKANTMLKMKFLFTGYGFFCATNIVNLFTFVGLNFHK